MFKKIYIEITNICNLHCKFCPVTNRKKEIMSVENFEKIIKQINKYTKLVCLHVKGEPLLHNDLQGIFTILEKYNLKTVITTNGTLINKQFEVLKNTSSVKQINFSIHSLTQNDKMDIEYLHNIFNTTRELKNIMISLRLWNLNSIKENEINKCIISEIEEFYKIKDLKNKLMENEFVKIADNVFINQDLEFIWPDINGKIINENGRCLALKDQVGILVDGTVVPCCLDNNGDIPLGNIFKSKFPDIINRDLACKIKSNFENNVITCDLCKTCGFLKKLDEKRKCNKK